MREFLWLLCVCCIFARTHLWLVEFPSGRLNENRLEMQDLQIGMSIQEIQSWEEHTKIHAAAQRSFPCRVLAQDLPEYSAIERWIQTNTSSFLTAGEGWGSRHSQGWGGQVADFSSIEGLV